LSDFGTRTNTFNISEKAPVLEHTTREKEGIPLSAQKKKIRKGKTKRR
jgi:hypothetical protein